MSLHRLLIALTLLALGTRLAAADEPAIATAKLHFERGEKLYVLARFTEALAEYQQAFDAKPLPELVFNVGQCYRNLGDYDAAVFSYRKYLQLEPEAPNRVQVEQLIADLEAKRDQAGPNRRGFMQPAVAAPAPAERPDRPPIYKKWWFWTAVAVVGTAGGVAIYEAGRSSGPPSTDLGNIVFGR